MLIENQTVTMQWVNNNKEYYQAKGYVFTQYKDMFKVNIVDLPHNSNKKIKLICDCCRKEYELTWYGYCKTHDKSNTVLKDYCNECKKSISQNNWYCKILSICEEYNYTLLTQKEDLKSNTTYISFECEKHGIHSMRVSNLINGKRCPKCRIDNARKRNQMNIDDVEEKINYCGGVLLNKSEYINNGVKNLKILCPECKKPFITSLKLFVQHGGQLCKECHDTESMGEKRIKRFLKNNNIQFEQEYWFDNCRDINPLPFDFYLKDFNTIIEFDGRQHFGETNHFSYSFEMVKKHDNIKNQFCQKNNIHLIRIPYWNINKIEDILSKKIILHEDIV